MKKSIIFLMVFLMLASVAFADIETDVRSIKDVIGVDGEAQFSVTVTNTAEENGFRLYYGGVEWDVPPRSFDLGRGQSESFVIVARPLYVNPGQHAIPLTIKSDTGLIKHVNLLVNVRTEENSEYQPSVSVGIAAPNSITPNEDLDLTLTLTNRNPLNLPNLVVNIDSVLFSHSEEVSLAPTTRTNLSKLVIQETFDVDHTVPPQIVPIVVNVLYNNKTVALQQRGIEIKQYQPGFDATIEEESLLFKKKAYVTIENVGNVVVTDRYKERLPLFRGVFSSEEPDAGILKEEGDRYLSWEFTLEPGEQREVVITTNYRPFILLLLIIIIGVVGYFTLRSPLNMSKSAQIIETKEGGISMLKVMLHVRNITGKPLENVKAYDKVPHLAHYHKEEQVGSLPPDKVVHSEKKGTVVSWDIGTLEPLEERIITYKIRTQFNILGGLTLPASTGRFKTRAGRQRVTKSSTFRLSLKQE